MDEEVDAEQKLLAALEAVDSAMPAAAAPSAAAEESVEAGEETAVEAPAAQAARPAGLWGAQPPVAAAAASEPEPEPVEMPEQQPVESKEGARCARARAVSGAAREKL